ncbi:class I SAM-dependent methyltransferase [Spirochaetia bacterium 38H-sp]|uniref:Class I SAM-dependent methyltransferase n=1 Tax=Rarispira pelagica TaxID=3141764 RepID=A0ABU9UDE2_9SPIR
MTKTFSTRPSNEPKRHIDCYVCGSAERRMFWQIESASYVKCKKCGFVYQYPQPVPDALAGRYDDSYFEYEIENESNFFDLMLKGLNDIRFFDELESLIKVKRILDIGCATGKLLSFFKSRGWDAYGIEICHQSAEYARKNYGLEILETPVESVDIENEYFGFIHSSHVIEHVPSPVAFLSAIYRLLVPGGYAVIVTPNVEGFQALLLREKWRSAIPDHTFLFSKHTLLSILEKQGFEIVAWKTWGGIAKGIVPTFIKKPFDIMAKLLGFGDVMLFLIRKPTVDL